jgi:hypothetical protein
MNQEVKTKWIQALRSGKYKQGQAYLREGEYYCCLGVLCDLNESRQWTHIDHPSKKIYSPFPNEDHQMLPKNISQWANLIEIEQDELIELNDTDNYTFEQIADYIEENL